MRHSQPFSCFIVGEGTLPIQCGEILLSRGHEICGIISPDASINCWAKEKNIPNAEPSDDLIAFLHRRPFDYLFSIVNIVNYHTLLRESLESPRKCAINYHDALLPTYAGFYPTSWSLMNRERTHGVTWHEMTDLIDAGNILKQCPVAVADDDTAFTLNAKCYDAAIRSFAELIEDLSSDRALARKQDLNKRTFFPMYERPTPGCVLRWDRRAHDIDAFIRALDFGPYPNPLGLPKLAVGKEFFIVSKVDVLDSISATPPGTVTTIDENILKVSTVDRDLALRAVLTIDGEPLSIPDLAARLKLRAGDRFGGLDGKIARCITASYASASRHEGFWIKRLSLLRPIRHPYAGRDVSNGQPAQYATVRLFLPEEVVTFLEYRGADWKTEDFLLAAFAAYLFRIAGDCRFDIGFSDVKLRRKLAGLEELFASHPPLRVNVEYTQSFTEFFHAVRGQAELVREHGNYARDIVARYPFLRSVPELQRGPVLPVIVEQTEKLDDYKAVSSSEFTLVTAENTTAYLWVYDSEVVNEENVVSMASQFAAFLKGIATDPDRQPIAELPLLTEKERRHLLVELNNTPMDYPHNRCFHQLFEAQVDRTPEAIALVVGDTQLTYRELNARANQLAHYLANCGVGPEIPVAICVERSVEMMVGLLGVLKAGGAYVPLHPDYPRERFALLLTDTKAPILLTEQRLIPRLPKHRAKTICLDSHWQTIEKEHRQNLAHKTTPGNLAYIIYTSGSTGKPNGVMIEHRSLVSYLCWVNESLMTNGLESVPLVSRLNFDASLKQLFAPLMRGSKVWALSDDVVMQPAVLLQALSTGTTVGLNCVPSLWVAILDAINSGQAAMPTENFRSLFLGGERLTKDLVQKSLAALPHLQIWNLYGPTETTANTIAARVHGEGKLMIGRPIANTQTYILDSCLHPVPIGIPGELYIGGVGLARGYLNRPELTAEKFIPNPFNNKPGGRLYKTGDKARYHLDGNIEFLGRIDNQVKIRGFRIELGEIEAMLNEHPGVREAVVVAREDIPGDNRLAGYVVRREAVQIGDLRKCLKEKLPDYMVPSAFVFLDALPLTSNGKIDRRALPAPDQRRPELESNFVEPRTPTEELLAKTWADVLKLEGVGVHDNFFDLGGHSLVAMQVISRLRNAFRVNLPLRLLFERPTVASLAEQIDTVLWVGGKYQLASETDSEEREEIEL